MIFINDLDLAVTVIDLIRKFADDTKLGHVVATAEQRQQLQSVLDTLMAWAATWGMEFNIKKCKVLHLGHSNVNHVYTMAGEELGCTTEKKDVGVAVTADLKPSAQCARAARTAAAVLGQITRTFHYRDRNIFVRLYKQYVLPHLDFSSAAWSPWTIGDIETLEKVQKRAVAMISGLAGRTYEDRLRKLGMVTL